MAKNEPINRRVADTMLRAINERKLELFDDIMAESFTDHHPGLGDGISTRESYVKMLKHCLDALQLIAELDVVFFQGEHTVVHGWMSGRHVGNFLGVPPTGNPVRWSFIEVYRIENGRIAERWSLDDLPGLLSQIGVKLPS